jgi:transcriptional regulator GlxA family with amidase domain
MSHFATAFKQAKDRSPHQYVLHHRMALAKELLRNPVRSVLEAYALTGFSTKAISAKSADALWALLLASFVHGHRGSDGCRRRRV